MAAIPKIDSISLLFSLREFLIFIHYIFYISIYVVQIYKFILWYSSSNDLSRRSNLVAWRMLCTKRKINNFYLISLLMLAFFSSKDDCNNRFYIPFILDFAMFVCLIPICTHSMKNFVYCLFYVIIEEWYSFIDYFIELWVFIDFIVSFMYSLANLDLDIQYILL